jgi:hypothetical protein
MIKLSGVEKPSMRNLKALDGRDMQNISAQVISRSFNDTAL